MNRTPRIAIATLLSTLAVAAFAQSPANTDEARALAAQDTARQTLAASFVRPQAEAVAVGDYRAAGHEQARAAGFEARKAAVLAYQAGVRSGTIAVNSEDSARAEAARHAVQAETARLAAYLAATPQAQHAITAAR